MPPTTDVSVNAPVNGPTTDMLPSEAEHTPAEVSAETPVAVSTTPFCAQRGSRLYHRSACDWARRIPDTDRLEFPDMSTATDKGLTGCPVCEPWEPR